MFLNTHLSQNNSVGIAISFLFIVIKHNNGAADAKIMLDFEIPEINFSVRRDDVDWQNAINVIVKLWLIDQHKLVSFEFQILCNIHFDLL